MIGYVVESEAKNTAGERVGTFRVYVATEARAKEIASQAADRTYRSMPVDEMPARAQENLRCAASEGPCS